MSLQQLFYLIGLFKIIAMQMVYQESQLNHTTFINCQSGIQINEWPIIITTDGACSLSNITLPDEGYYLYTLVFKIINTDIQFYIDSSLYYLNSSQVPVNSYSVQIQHYRQKIDLQASIDIVPQQSVFLQRIFIEPGNAYKQLGFINFNRTYYSPSYSVEIRALILQGKQLNMLLSIDNTVLSYFHLVVNINNKNITIGSEDDIVYCKCNLSSLQLYDTRITYIYNFTVVLNLYPISGLQNPCYQPLNSHYSCQATQSQLLTYQYFIQITNGSTQRIYPLKPTNPKVIIDTSLREMNDGTHSSYQFSIGDISNGNCIQDLVDVKFTLKNNYSQQVINVEMIEDCIWLIYIPDQIQRGINYKLRFKAKLLNSTLNLEDEISIFLPKKTTYLEDFQQAIYVFLIIQFGLTFGLILKKYLKPNMVHPQNKLSMILTNSVDELEINCLVDDNVLQPQVGQPQDDEQHLIE